MTSLAGEGLRRARAKGTIALTRSLHQARMGAKSEGRRFCRGSGGGIVTSLLAVRLNNDERDWCQFIEVDQIVGCRRTDIDCQENADFARGSPATRNGELLVAGPAGTSATAYF